MKHRLAFWMYETALKLNPQIQEMMQDAFNETARLATLNGFKLGQRALLEHQRKAARRSVLQ